ncbi:hypothetical protein [Nostoc sp.]|uniref:hypothetical protein n=1 Tax=Nostoc sp. TaxID=1180 RepID=UPI002FFA47DD
MHKKPSWATSRGLGFWLIAKRGGINTLANSTRPHGQLVEVQDRLQKLSSSRRFTIG